MVNNIALLMAAVSSLSLTAMSKKSETRSFAIYSEDCIQRYELRVDSDKAVLLDNETETVVETFTSGSNPYSNADDYDFLVYTDKREDCRYLGVLNDKIVNLETGLEVTVAPETNDSDIHSALIKISSDQIPSKATMCKYGYYFKHLDEYGFGDNTKGTCSLVAMQILFGYYDSVFNDNVIEENYDNPVSENAMTCGNFAKSPSSKGDEFHSYLINYCNSELKLSVENRGLSNIEQFNLINTYIGTSRNLKYTHNTSEGNTSDVLSGKQFGVVKDAINNGRPAILNTLHHSMVAFGYDNTYVYLMSGWRDKVICKLNWNDFNGNIFTNHCGAYDLTITSAHSCSNNYYSKIVNAYVCPEHGIHE